MAIGWCYDLLRPEEQALFDQLATLAGAGTRKPQGTFLIWR